MMQRNKKPTLKTHVAAVLSAFCLALAGCTASGAGSTPTPTDTVEPSPPILTLLLGQCTEDIDFFSDSLRSVQEVPCNDPHYYEVHKIIPLEQSEYPSEIELNEIATTECGKSFESYVGVSAEYSRYASTFLAPDENAWKVPADRRLVCLAGSPEGGLTGSLKGDVTIFPTKGQCTGKQDVPPLDIKIINCDKKHYFEVYATSKISGKTAPTGKKLDKLIDDVCVAGFKDFIGKPVATSKYDFSWFLADAETWSKVKDHRIVCSVGLIKGGVTGSLKGVKK